MKKILILFIAVFYFNISSSVDTLARYFEVSKVEEIRKVANEILAQIGKKNTNKTFIYIAYPFYLHHFPNELNIYLAIIDKYDNITEFKVIHSCCNFWKFKKYSSPIEKFSPIGYFKEFKLSFSQFECGNDASLIIRQPRINLYRYDYYFQYFAIAENNIKCYEESSCIPNTIPLLPFWPYPFHSVLEYW